MARGPRFQRSRSTRGSAARKIFDMKHIFSKLAVIVLATSGAAAFAADNPATATFQVKMTILKACSVVAGAASDIQLGAPAGVDSTATNVQGSNAINVTCSKNTPYNIGLVLTSNSANTAGLGAMSGTGGNTDMVPYQLYSDAARTAVWGSTATGGALATVGNGVHGTGSGGSQPHTVYATAPSANFTPDNYADTVTVRVTY